MEKIRIEDFETLVTVLNRKEVTNEIACDLVAASMSVWLNLQDKKGLIEKAKRYHEKWKDYRGERPIFL